jgi:glycosyltransferase involved in cell wall biosynthesis
MSPAISVVIATHNYGRFLPAALESVLRQTFGDFEVIVVDDGSTDNTREVVQPYLLDPRVRYQRIIHGGVSAARNTGIRLARAGRIAFLDADDRWLPAKLELQAARFDADPELGVVYTRRLVIDDAGRPLPFREPPLYRGHVLPQIFATNFVCFSSAMVRRKVFEQVGMFDESIGLAVDYDLWLRAATCYCFDYLDQPLVKYRRGAGSLSERVEERLLTVLTILHRFLDERGGRELVPAEVVSDTYSRVYNGLALASRERSRLAALQWYVRALAQSPRLWPAWKGLASLPLPEAVRRLLRLALGRPPTWRLQPASRAA